MNRFAKLFEVGEYQLLIYLDETDDNDDEYTALHQMTDLGGALLDLTMRGPDKAMKLIFDGYEQESAARFFETETVKEVIGMVVKE